MLAYVSRPPRTAPELLLACASYGVRVRYVSMTSGTGPARVH